MRSSMRRRTPAIGEGTHGRRAAWTTARCEKSAFSSIGVPSTARTATLVATLLLRRLLRRLRLPAQHGLPCGQRFVEARARRVIGRAMEIGGVARLCARGEALQHADVAVEAVLALGLGRLHQQRAMHYQREI